MSADTTMDAIDGLGYLKDKKQQISKAVHDWSATNPNTAETVEAAFNVAAAAKAAQMAKLTRTAQTANTGKTGKTDVSDNFAEANRSSYTSQTAENITNADRVGSGLKADSSHRAASYLSQEQLASGKTFQITGGDGIQRTLLQTKGSLNGQKGIYEYIIDSNKKVTHQRFIKGGEITGQPNQRVKNK